ncbi:MAG: ABC transporter substrate-binding protein [Deltaproteobacteria bacterium]|nr:ABC transporter substrate-binding protein [Deltaproteobacteria bacterium]
MNLNARSLVIVWLLLAVLAPGTVCSQERLKVIYSQFTMTNSAGWFAQEAGLFERHGISVDLVYVDSTPAVHALTAGQAPIGIMSGGLAVGPYLNGLDIVMLGAWCNLLSYQLITRPEIRRPEDLRGKVIGIGRFGAAADWGARLILRKLGLNDTRDVQIIQAGGGGPATRLAAMHAKKFDATVLDPPSTVLARRAGFRALADGADLGIPFLQGGLVTRQSFIRSHEDIVQRIVRVTVEAIHYAKTNREGALAVMQKYLRTQDREALEEAYEAFVVKQFPKAPYVLPAGLQTIFDLAAARDPRARSADPQGFIDMRFVRELEQSGIIDHLYGQTR